MKSTNMIFLEAVLIDLSRTMNAFFAIFLLLIIANVIELSRQDDDKVLFRIGSVFYRENKRSRRVVLKDVKNIDQHQFSKVIEMKVQVKDEGLKVLYEGAVRNMQHLRELRMPKCGILKIEPKAFRNLPSIARIFLQENKLTTIEEGVFNYLPVEELSLHRNRISTIRSGAFDNMPNLVTIKLNGNKITEWNSDWFKNTPALTNLYFRRNQIREIPPKAFTNLKSSHKVNDEELVDLKIFFSKNKISKVHPDAFKGLDSIYQIWLDRNHIRELDRNLFAHLTQMEGVYLDKNMISEIDKYAFKNLEELSNLDVSRNNLTCLPYEIVAITETVIVEGNSMDCDCLFNLRAKLKDEDKENKIIDSKDCVVD